MDIFQALGEATTGDYCVFEKTSVLSFDNPGSAPVITGVLLQVGVLL